MPTVYIPDDEFRKHIWDAEDRAHLVSVDGKNRWKITREDGTEYIARPLSAKHE